MINWLKQRIEKASMAILVSAVIVVGGFLYAVYIQDTEMVKYFAGFGLGFLFGNIVANET